MTQQTVISYLIERLTNLKVNDFFGVPGDYSFEIINEIQKNSEANWIGCCNELNAAYAADGYSRIKGLGCCVTTYGVGELSAINGITGAYAHNIPVVKIVGMPPVSDLEISYIIHHTLGDGRWKMYADAYTSVIKHGVILSKDNAYAQIEEALNIAVTDKKPVYIAVPKDVALSTIIPKDVHFNKVFFDDEQSAHMVLEKLKNAKKPVLLLDSLVLSYHLEKTVSQLADKLEIPCITTPMGKGCISEENPYFCGVFSGDLLNPKTKRLFEESDCILAFGLLWTDFNTGFFSVELDKSKLINIKSDAVDIFKEEIKLSSVQNFSDILVKNAYSMKYEYEKFDAGIENPHPSYNDAISCDIFFYLLQDMFLKKDDIVVSETGMSDMGMINCKLPEGCNILSQLLYLSIGWALPASFGVQMAACNKRVILISGDGSTQLTVQELSSMYRHSLNPIVFILNNNGYTIERLLSKEPANKFNNIATWDWEKIPQAFCGDSYFCRARTVKDLFEAFKEADRHERPCFIEVMLPEMDLPLYARNLKKMIDSKTEFNI